MDGLVLRNGFWWPQHDELCHPIVPDQAADLEQVIPLCKQRRIAVQAGGNVGVWAKRLERDFDKVITFEPDPTNFRCLALNLPEMNVIKFQAALGHRPGMVAMDLDIHNVGAHRVIAGNGTVCITLDSLNLPACDLLYLDVEGYEMPAILGATDTIQFHKPVIAYEAKGLGTQYGFSDESLYGLLKEHGYREALRLHRDIIMVPE